MIYHSVVLRPRGIVGLDVFVHVRPVYLLSFRDDAVELLFAFVHL